MKNSWLNWKSSLPYFLAISAFFAAPHGIRAEPLRLEIDNFILEGDFAEEKLRAWGDLVEERRRDIAHELGFFDLKTWFKPCQIYFAKSARDFAMRSGAPEWAGGWNTVQIQKRGTSVQVKSRTIWVRADRPEKELEPLLSHEIAHILFREYLDFPRNLPLWLDEGVALWAESLNRPVYRNAVRQAVRKERAFPLKNFFSMRVYPRDKRLFYSQASSIIDFLISEYGVHELQRFSRLIRDGASFDEAMSQIYQVDRDDLPDFEQRWKEWVLARES